MEPIQPEELIEPVVVDRLNNRPTTIPIQHDGTMTKELEGRPAFVAIPRSGKVTVSQLNGATVEREKKLKQ